ncbi:MAG: lactate racemase domain-containing protein [Treponema sp.]|jgi:nickel-dependent lactate racemase|nr:lactate racemase domain-containing protein [Treponema sp.]
MEKTFLSKGGASLDLSGAEADSLFSETLSAVRPALGKTGSALLIPPDVTRFHSRAGFFTDIACRELSAAGIRVTVLPALGTHMALTGAELARMFPNTPPSLFRVHDWRNDVVELGRIEKEWIEKVTEGAVSYDWPVQVNKLLRDGGFDLIVSLGQVVPHEVIGMANHAKNIFVGTGGKEAIDKSHFAGAAFGMERMMGRAETPVRAMFDEGLRRYGDRLPPILYVLTVLSARSGAETSAGGPRGGLALRGLYAGFGRECFEQAAALARQVNVDLLDEPVKKAVVYLEPEEFRTTWLGNKAIYRTRMAMADGGELLIIAPGLERFGEDKGIDVLIRKYGYRPARVIREKAQARPELADSLSAAAHLIHGSSEGRFTVRYCPGPGLSREEIESVGYEWGGINEAMNRYDINKLKTGWNAGDDGRFFFVPNPALGLWALKDSF